MEMSPMGFEVQGKWGQGTHKLFQHITVEFLFFASGVGRNDRHEITFFPVMIISWVINVNREFKYL
jgi:hypothetical protein